MAAARNCVLALSVLLATGLLYTGCAFRIRDNPATSEVCHSGKCPGSSPSPGSPWPGSASASRPRRGFEPVSTRGGFAKGVRQQQPPDAPEAADQAGGPVLKKKEKKLATRPWSKLSKVEDVGETEEDALPDVEESGDRDRIDSDDEAVQIEVEDEDEVVIESESEEDDGLLAREKSKREEEERKKREKEEQERRKKEEEEKKRKQRELELERKRKEEEERRRKEKEKEEKRKREEEERRQREEAERLLREEAEQRLREEEERRIREAEEQRIKEEEERRRREEEQRKKREEEERRKREAEERKKREEEERRKREAEERKKREEEERRKREAEERKKREEEERKKREEEERLKREEEERRLKEEEEQRLREEEERRRREEEEERLRDEEECRLREEEEERLREEEDRRKKEEEEREAERKRKEEEERKKKELEAKEAARKKKEEEARKRKEREEQEAERRRDAEEDKKRVERVKREAEEKKKREEEEKRKKRAKVKADVDDDDEDEDEDEEAVSASKSQEKAAEPPKPLASKTAKDAKPKSKPEDSNKSKAGKAAPTKKPTAEKPKPRTPASLSLAELNDVILSVPTFVPNFTAVEDPACQQHGKIFLRQLRGYKLWALQMLDSSAKIPSGLLRGNVNQLGDFDQCLGVAARVKVEDKTVKVQGKYCLASMDLYATSPATRLPVNLLQSRALIRGNMRDPGHFVPKFTTVNWALCLPAACSAEDARRTIENALEYYNATVGIRFVVDVDPEMCYVQQKATSYSKETIGVLYFYAIFVCLAVVATLRDYFATLQEKGNYSERIIMAFSLKRTLKALFENREESSSDIGCIHGIRSLSTIALYAAHKLIPISRMPYANRVQLTEVASNPLSTLLRASLFYTDSFLLLSGVLTAHNMAKELSRRNEIRWFCRFIARFMRLTPSLLAVVFWYAFVMEHTGSGPQWNSAVKANADICKENAWINLLYVQNFFPFEEMCATHTHQLALDMQLSLLAPALVFFLQIKPVLGIVIVFFLIQVSATLRYLATSNNNLSLVIFHGMTMKHLYKTANLTYSLPLHRATPYLFGVSVGVLLHYTGKNVRIHKIFAAIGWLIALALGSWSLFSPWRLARRDYAYDVEEATHYAVMSPILTAIALSWTIFACFTDHGGIINRILSSYWMKVFSRLSYAIYLSQFAVFFYNVGSARYSSEFQPHRTIDLFEALGVLSVSIVLTLLFDIPMQEVKSIIMEVSDSQPVEESEQAKESAPEESRNNVGKGSQVTPSEEEEPNPGGWNWSRGTFKPGNKSEPREYEENGGFEEPFRSSRLKRQDIRRQTMIRSEAYDEWSATGSRRASRSEEYFDDGRGSRGDYSRMSNSRLEDDLDYLHPRERYFSGRGVEYSNRSPMRDLDAPVFRRSVSRERPVSKEQDVSARDYGKKPLITISKEEDYQRSPRSSMPRFSDQQRSLSSESDFDGYGSRRSSASYGPNRRASAEPRISDEDDWEEELRIRRSRYLQERVSSQERDRPPPVLEEESSGGDDEWADSLKRRSSAEGKMALLKEPLRPGNMELWTVSKMQLGSSQEPDEEELDEEMYLQQRREYREQGPPLREEFEGEELEADEQQKGYATESLPTSFEEDDVANLDFVLKRNSKKITVQDLSKLSPDEDISADNSWNKLDVNKSGLFKRESIVKSQASEEDPEYLLPERPKLVEQEQEHPFKKAWQMQKSRSEEEGPAGFVVKVQESKPAVAVLDKQKDKPEEKKEQEDEGEEKDKSDRDGAQSEDIPEADVTCDVTIVWQPRLSETEDAKSSSTRSETSSAASSQRFDWPDEDEQYEAQKSRRKSDEDNWTWDT